MWFNYVMMIITLMMIVAAIFFFRRNIDEVNTQWYPDFLNEIDEEGDMIRGADMLDIDFRDEVLNLLL